MDFGAPKRPRSKNFGKDVNLPRTVKPPQRVTPAKRAAGGLSKIKSGLSRLRGGG